MQIAKHETMRSVNTGTVLNCLFSNGALTRQELQKKTGLSWGTVSNIISSLLSMGILCEMPMQHHHAGRKPSVVTINPNDNLCIGVDIHMQGITCVVTDLGGRVIVSQRRSIVGLSRDSVMGRAIDLVHDAITKLHMTSKNFVGIGVSIQGAIDRDGRVSLYSPHLPDWSNVPVAQLLQDTFGLPVMLFHDTSAMIIAERRYSEHCVRNMAFVKLDMGVGMAMVVDDQLYSGADGNAGEFGHTIIDPEGPLCTCGNHGCLEAYASGRSLLEQVRCGVEAGKCSISFSGDEYDRQIALVAERARHGGAFEAACFARLGRYLGIGLSNLINFFNPELIVLGGDMARYTDLYLQEAKAVVGRNVWNYSRIQIAPSLLEQSDAAVGAAIAFTQNVIAGHIPHAIGALFCTLHNSAEMLPSAR